MKDCGPTVICHQTPLPPDASEAPAASSRAEGSDFVPSIFSKAKPPEIDKHVGEPASDPAGLWAGGGKYTISVMLWQVLHFSVLA